MKKAGRKKGKKKKVYHRDGAKENNRNTIMVGVEERGKL